MTLGAKDVQTVIQNAGIAQARWTMTSCTFHGTSGRMDGLLTTISAVSLTVPVIANHTYR